MSDMMVIRGFCIKTGGRWAARQKFGMLHLVRGMMCYLLNKYYKQKYFVCINSAYLASVTMCITFLGLESLVKKKH